MSLKDLFIKQMASVIEWKEQNPSVLFSRLEMPTDEIKNASKLIVAPGQGCIIVYEGKVRDVLTEQGIYNIETDNHPFFTTLTKIRYMFESEHKLYIYYFRTVQFVNIGWGTAMPVKYMDSVYKFPVQLGAYGNYSVAISDAKGLFENVIGSNTTFTTDDLQAMMSSRITPVLASYLAKAAYNFTEIDAQLHQLSEDIETILVSEYLSLGFKLTDFRIQGTSFDKDTLERIDRIADMTTEALAASEVNMTYADLQKLQAMRDAVKTEGGLAGMGMQMGIGLEMGKMFNSGKLASSSSTEDPIAQLKQLKLLVDEGILTQDEFENKKKEILGRI